MANENILVIPVGVTGPVKAFLQALVERVDKLETELEVLRNG